MAEFLKSQAPQELWKASLKPKDPLKPDEPTKPVSVLDPAGAAQGPKAPGTGVVLDVTA